MHACNAPIDLSPFTNHPIVFIPQESPSGWKSKEEQQLFENMPIYSKLLNFLFHIDGSYKYFASADVKLGNEPPLNPSQPSHNHAVGLPA